MDLTAEMRTELETALVAGLERSKGLEALIQTSREEKRAVDEKNRSLETLLVTEGAEVPEITAAALASDERIKPIADAAAVIRARPVLDPVEPTIERG